MGVEPESIGESGVDGDDRSQRGGWRTHGRGARAASLRSRWRYRNHDIVCDAGAMMYQSDNLIGMKYNGISCDQQYIPSCSPKVGGRDSSVRRAIRPAEDDNRFLELCFLCHRPSEARTPAAAFITAAGLSGGAAVHRVARRAHPRSRAAPHRLFHEIFRLVAGERVPGGSVSLVRGSLSAVAASFGRARGHSRLRSRSALPGAPDTLS